MSRRELAPRIGALLNRYTNAAHWIDYQIGRVLDEIEAQGLLENTVVIVTDDHGEEFMEKGAWGHNSGFVEEQIHAPSDEARVGGATIILAGSRPLLLAAVAECSRFRAR